MSASAFVIAGSVVWSNRNAYEPQEALARSSVGEWTELTTANHRDLAELCTSARSGASWMLIVAEVSVVNDRRYRGYFETAQQGAGLLLEYSPGDGAQLRIGVPMDGGQTHLAVRTVRRPDTVFLAMGVMNDDLRILANGTDYTHRLVPETVASMRCDRVVVGETDYGDCPDCMISVRFTRGTDRGELERVLSAVSNSRRSFMETYVGNGMIIAGLVTMAVILRRARRHGRHELRPTNR